MDPVIPLVAAFVPTASKGSHHGENITRNTSTRERTESIIEPVIVGIGADDDHNLKQ